MPAFPTIIPAAVTILVPGGAENSYDYFLASLNSVSYKVNSIYIQTQDTLQQNAPLQVYRYNQYGTINIAYEAPIMSLYVLPAVGVVNLSTAGKKLVLDSNTFLNYTIQPNAMVTLIFYYTYLDLGDLLPTKI